ncbi:MAG: hypothetical protein OHK0039_42120 [Bacteroidia bacterium]
MLLVSEQHINPVEWARTWGIQELCPEDLAAASIAQRVQRLLEEQALIAGHRQHTRHMRERQIPLAKRIFDIAVSGTALLLLGPLLLIVALLIKLESRGPVFYISKRVGTGYRVFDFYKFRSMRADADKMVAQLQHLNQYAQKQAPAPETVAEAVSELPLSVSDDMLVSDEAVFSEEAYREQQRQAAGQAFFKIEQDPRITRVGKWIRNTSIDELPQLLNVLKGDMSIVGNRPLPLYEAEKLTTDQWTQRFMAPAGITGLWQVKERGKAGVEGDRRMMLDVIYARKYSLWLDIKIVLMTIPALLQQENV